MLSFSIFIFILHFLNLSIAWDFKAVVDQINNIRNNVSPKAGDMQTLLWDPTLANNAQEWANKCVYSHDPSYKDNSEAIGRGGTPNSLVNLWYESKKNFLKSPYDPFVWDWKTSYQYSLYTQMVWASTNRIGCGFAKCEGGDILVCRFYPPGNQIGKPVYNPPIKNTE